MDELVDYYEKDYRAALYSYKMMGKMLDRKKVLECVNKLRIKEVYIYGGGYLGIQLYNAIREFAEVKAIVDQAGKLAIEGLEGVTVINFDKFKEDYMGENVIITLPLYFERIQENISEFADNKKVFYLGEFLEGGIQ